MNYLRLIITVFVSAQCLQAAEEPEDLIKLREAYQQAQERAMAPLQQKYISGLEAMKLRMTKAGKLQDALAVDAELKAMVAKTEEEPAEEVKSGNHPDNLVGQWYCNGVESDVYEIRKGNKAQHMGTKGEWKYEDGLFTIQWENGFRLTFDAEQKGNVIKGMSYPPGATSAHILQFIRK